ncbi:MAG: hydrolase family protein [Naasia sp.]|nr:hydrolase family protein [Naasia sp.]
MNPSVSRRALAALVTATLLGAASVGLAAPASAAPAPSSSIDYIALGDSYAAGQGVLPYSDPACKRSKLGYPALLDKVPLVQLRANVSCSGALTSAVSAQLAAVGPAALAGAEVVTISVGGNDLGAGAVFGACVANPDPPACAALVGGTPDRIAGVAAGLAGALAAVKAQAPKARIVVTGYPQLIHQPAFGSHPQAALIAQVNAGSTALNTAIKAVVAQAGSQVRYADVTGFFAGHGVGSRLPFIIGPGSPTSPNPDAFHPNALGQLAYAAAVTKAALSR